MKKKNLKDLIDRFYDRNQDLQKQVEYLKEEVKRLEEDFVKNYDYVVLIKDYKTRVYEHGHELKHVRTLEMECEAYEIPSIKIEMS